MKKAFVGLFFLASAVTVSAQPPAGEAKPGDFYGEKVNPQGAIAISQVPAKLEQAETFGTKVKGKVLDVCPKKGCWVSLQVNDSTTAFVKMKNYGFFVPTALKGKTVVLEGVARMKTTSVEELRHYAEDAKKSQAEIDAITKPEREIRFEANGITVVE